MLPLFHVGGLQVLLRSAIYGTTAVIEPEFDVDRVRALLEGGDVTLASFVPTMVRRLREAGWQSAPRLRAALVGGGPVPRDLLEWAAERGLPLLQTYGMTETASQIVTAAGGPDAPARPLHGVELPDRGRRRAAGPRADGRPRARCPTTAGCTRATADRSAQTDRCTSRAGSATRS